LLRSIFKAQDDVFFLPELFFLTFLPATELLCFYFHNFYLNMIIANPSAARFAIRFNAVTRNSFRKTEIEQTETKQGRFETATKGDSAARLKHRGRDAPRSQLASVA
jgi:hypothetical protein